MSIESYTMHEASCDGCELAFNDEFGRATFDIHYNLIKYLQEDGWEADMLSDYVLCPACQKEGKKR